MGWVITGLVCAALIAGAFWLGRATGRRRWAWVAAVLPVGLLIWAAIADATEDTSDCYEECGSVWLYAFAVVSVLPALVLAGTVVIGAISRRRAR